MFMKWHNFNTLTCTWWSCHHCLLEEGWNNAQWWQHLQYHFSNNQCSEGHLATPTHWGRWRYSWKSISSVCPTSGHLQEVADRILAVGKRPQIQHGLCQWEKEEELHLCSEYILESILYSTGADPRNMKELNYHRIYPIEMLTWLRSRFSMLWHLYLQMAERVSGFHSMVQHTRLSVSWPCTKEFGEGALLCLIFCCWSTYADHMGPVIAY